MPCRTCAGRAPCPISELANELKISKQQITPLICKLIDSGLVARKADEHDRRIVHIEITVAGRDTVQALVAEIKQAFVVKLEVLPMRTGRTGADNPENPGDSGASREIAPRCPDGGCCRRGIKTKQ